MAAVPEIPRHRGALTAAWFNEALGRGSRLVPPEIVSIRIDDSVLPGMMSDVVRVIPTYVRPRPASAVTPPRSFIVKLSSGAAAMRTRVAGRLAYLKEVRFYQRLAPALNFPSATCFYADVDLDSGYHVLVLEDLAPAVRRPLAEGCSRAEAERAVLELARLHARWWESPELAKLDWLPEPARLDLAEARDQQRRWWPEFLAVAGHRLPTETLEFGEALAEKFAPLMNYLLFSAPRTLRHGDYSLSNMLFPGEVDNRSASGPDAHDDGGRFAVIDWQLLSRGKGPWDLAWFLGQSLTVAQRRGWEAELLGVYHQALLAGSVRNYDIDRCRQDYRRAIGQRFGTLISSIVALPFSAAQKAEILGVQLPRNVAAIGDHGGLSILDGV